LEEDRWVVWRGKDGGGRGRGQKKQTRGEREKEG